MVVKELASGQNVTALKMIVGKREVFCYIRSAFNAYKEDVYIAVCWNSTWQNGSWRIGKWAKCHSIKNDCRKKRSFLTLDLLLMLTNRMFIQQFVEMALDKMVVDEMTSGQNVTALKMIVGKRGLLYLYICFECLQIGCLYSSLLKRHLTKW